MQTVVITGITGKSGQFFLQKMMNEHDKLHDYRFILLCRKHDAKSKNTLGYKLIDEAAATNKLDIILKEVDLLDENSVRAVFSEHVDMLLHIASVKLTMNIVPVALEAGVDNIVMVHTTGIYSKYKAAGEEYRQIEHKVSELVDMYKKQGRKIATTILRPTMIYGDLQDGNVATFIKMVDKLRIFPTVNGARYDLQPVWCKNLGDAYFDVMVNWDITKNKEYILSGGEPIQLRDMFKEMARQLGVKNTFISCPFPIAYAGAWCICLLTLKKIDMREKVQRLVEPRAYGHELASTDFGYAPAAFAEGVRDELEMYKRAKA